MGWSPVWISNPRPSKVWNEITYPFPRLHHLKFGMNKWFHPTLSNGCNYVSILKLNFIHVKVVKGAPWWCYRDTLQLINNHAHTITKFVAYIGKRYFDQAISPIIISGSHGSHTRRWISAGSSVTVVTGQRSTDGIEHRYKVNHIRFVVKVARGTHFTLRRSWHNQVPFLLTCSRNCVVFMC